MGTQSKFFADVGLQTSGNTAIGGNLSVDGNLTVSGTSMTVNSTTTSITDSMMELANGNTASDLLDIGFYGNYDDGLSDGASEYTGFFRDASDSTWKLFDGLEVEPSSTVNVGGTGYTLADMQVGDLTATTLTATNGLTGSSITYPTSDGTSGQVIKTNGSGTLSFGNVSLDSLSDCTISASTPTATTNPPYAGAMWIEEDTGDVYVCTNATTDNNTWVKTGTTDGIITSGSTTIIQSQDDTNVIHVNNSADVGIGTASPAAKFHVDGNMLLNTGSPDLYLGTGNGHYNWRIAAQEVVNKGFEIASGTTAEGSTAPSDTYTTRFTVLADNGDVVIGNSGGVARRDLGSNTAPVVSLEGSFPAHNLRDSDNGTGSFWGINGDTMYLGGHTGTALLNHYVNGSPQLQLRTNGNTQPNQPSFFCYPSASFSASGGSIKYIFDSEAHDSNNEYNHTTGKFTAPTAGRYMFLCNLGIQASTSELTYIGIGVRKNNTGSVYYGGWSDKQATSNSHYAQASSSIIMYLAQGDYVELYIELSGTHSVLGGNSGAYTRFCGQLLS